MNAPDARTLNRRLDDLEAALARLNTTDQGGGAAMLARTTTIASYPTVAQACYAVQPLLLTGPEREGGPVTLTALAQGFFALNLGSTVPVTGTVVVLTHVGNRWVFRHDG